MKVHLFYAATSKKSKLRTFSTNVIQITSEHFFIISRYSLEHLHLTDLFSVMGNITHAYNDVS